MNYEEFDVKGWWQDYFKKKFSQAKPIYIDDVRLQGSNLAVTSLLRNWNNNLD